MATSVSICSNALQMLGQNSFSSFEESNDFVRAAANIYPTARDHVLRSHYWNCAIKRVILAPLTEKPPFDFGYQFSLPGDWIRTLQIGETNRPISFQVEGNRILANVSVLPIVYVFRNEVEATWSANLIKVMELYMASQMAYIVTGSTSLRDSYRDEYMRELKVAKAIDGQDNPPEEFPEGTLRASRF